MISSWARMCKILGKDFEKYLPVVMGPVLKTASFKPEIAVVDGEEYIFEFFALCHIIFICFSLFSEEEVKEISDEEDWQFVTIGDQVSQKSKSIKLTVQQKNIIKVESKLN
jgi:hypothetical protein